MSPHLPQLNALMAAAAGAVEAGDDARAEPLLLQIVALNSRDAEAWNMLAVIALRAGRAADASERAERAHRLERRNHVYLNTLGIALGESQRFEDAQRCFKRALKERPDYVDAHYNLGKVLGKADLLPEAEAAYRRALQLAPGRTDVVANLGTLYCRMFRFEEALPLLEHAASASPEDQAIAGNLALALLGVRGARAASLYLASFVARSADSEVRGNLALSLLSEGHFEEGWREYALSPRTPTAAAPSRLADRLPQPLEGSDVLLIPEQGIGDHLFFLRFAPLLRKRGARVALVASAKLFEMLKGNPGLDDVIQNGAEVPDAFARAFPVLIGNLPGWLGCTEAPSPFPILVDQAKMQAWRSRLAQLGPPPYLAVTWRGGRRREPQPEFVPQRPIPLYKEIGIDTLAQAASGWRGTVLVLQRAPTAEELARFSRALGRPAHDLSASNNALEEMAALLGVVDEYVGVSNTNMHIRAGIGRTGRVLIPFPAEFRWMHAGDASPWFPGFRLYRQTSGGNWEDAISLLSKELTQ